jgi:hypothetical protein
VDNNCRLLYTRLQPKARQLLSVIGRNNQEEEDGCADQDALSVLRATLKVGAGKGQRETGRERSLLTAQALCSQKSSSSFLASYPCPSPMRFQSQK